MADEQVTANVRLTAPDETLNVMVQLCLLYHSSQADLRRKSNGRGPEFPT
jgi:hypothetical protein